MIRDEKRVQELVRNVKSAIKREEAWRKKAQACVEIYECKNTEEIPYNILYANTALLRPATYSNLAIPIIKQRYKTMQPDALNEKAAEVAQKLLMFLISNPDPKYPSIHELIKTSVLGGFVAGRGTTRIKYDAEIEQYEKETGEKEENVSYQTVCGEDIPWDRLAVGYAKTWEETPWIAIIHYVTKEAAKELLEDPNTDQEVELPDDLRFNATEQALKTERHAFTTGEGEDLELAEIYEVWDKEKRTVEFVSEGCGYILKKLDDPLNLQGFYPIPKPLQYAERVSGQVPQTIYDTYKQQADELNTISVRIRKVMAALKVRGFYDSSLEGMEELFKTGDDNTLIKIEGIDQLTDASLDKVLFLFPLEKLVSVLQMLYQQREQIKAVIYELTGLSDIARGASKASETLGAQQLKSQWGSIRLKEYQGLTIQYVVDLYRIILEIAVQSFSIDTIARMTGEKLPTNAQKMQAQQQMMQAQQMSPEQQQGIAQQLKQLQMILSMPAWEDIMAILKDDFTRNYNISIETNSTLEFQYSEDKENIGEFLNALAQFMNGIAPLVQSQVLPMDAAKSILIAIVKRYRFGEEVVEQFEQMVEPPAPQPDPAQQAQAEAIKQKQQQEAEKHQLDMQSKQQDMQIAAKDAQIKEMEAQAKMQQMQREQVLADQEHAAKMEEIARKNQLSIAKFNAALRKIQLQEREAKETENASV